MGRLTPKTNTLKALFAKSGNQCAFPGCDHPMINKKNQFIGQVCHIESALPGGERFNKESNDEFRRCYENLILLCYPHHIETNDENEFTVSVMNEMKKQHEEYDETSSYEVEETPLRKIEKDLDDYWSNVERLNTIDHAIPELALEIGGEREVLEIIENLNQSVSSISDVMSMLASSDHAIEDEFKEFLRKKNIDPSIFADIPYYENPFINRNWEYHALASTNTIARISVDILVLEIKYLEQYVQSNTDKELQERLSKAKEELESIAGSIGYAD